LGAEAELEAPAQSEPDALEDLDMTGIDLSVLAVMFAAYPQNAVPEQPAAEEPANPQTAETDGALGAGTKLVDILEGTAVTPATADGTDKNNGSMLAEDIGGGRWDMARMPQTMIQTGIQQIPEERGDTESGLVRDDMPCPLENVSEEGDLAPASGLTGKEREEPDGGSEEQLNYAPPGRAAAEIAPEKISAAELLKSAPGETPQATRESLFEVMVEKLEVMNEDGVRSMSVQLKPEYLGRVTLHLTMAESGGVNLRISAADPGVKGMIDGRIAAMVEDLSGKGVKIERVDVVYTAVGGGERDRQGERSGGGEKRGSARGRRAAAAYGVGATSDAGMALEQLRADGLGAETGAYEYSA
jgi:hypothetical protein